MEKALCCAMSATSARHSLHFYWLHGHDHLACPISDQKSQRTKRWRWWKVEPLEVWSFSRILLHFCWLSLHNLHAFHYVNMESTSADKQTTPCPKKAMEDTRNHGHPTVVGIRRPAMYFLCLDCVYYCMENSKLYQKLGTRWMENSSQLYLSSGNALHWLWLFITQFYCHFNPLETLSINLRHKKILVKTKTRKVVENTKIYMQECRIPICWHTSHFSLLHHFSNSFSLPKAAVQTFSSW